MSKQLKIAMISYHSCPAGKLGGKDTGGMNVYIRELSQELAKRGHLIDIFTRTHQPEHKQIINFNNNIRLIHLETGIKEEIPKIAFYSCLQEFICGAENFRKSVDIQYDIIHSHYWLSGLAGKQLQTWWHIPHLFTFHTLGAAKNKTGIGEDESELRIASEREIVQSCDRIIALTDNEKKELIQYYDAVSQRISIIPCGVNLDLFKPVNKELARNELKLGNNKIILFVGRLDKLKGIEKLLIALNKITASILPSLIVVGGDDYSRNEMKELQMMTQDLGIRNRVTFVGSIIQEKLPLFYNAADICVIPSYYESFGMVALESLACGTPVLATNVGDMKNIIRSSELGYVIDDNSPGNLANKISEILSQNENYAQNIEVRRSVMAEYNWSVISDLILAEYDNSLNNFPVAVNL